MIPRRVIRPEVIRLLREAQARFPLNQRERIALGLLAQGEGLTATEFADQLELIEPAEVSAWIGRLTEWDLVQQVGRTRATRYFVSPELLHSAGFVLRTTLKRVQPHRLWLAVDADERPIVALSRWDVARVLTNGAPSLPVELPEGAAAVHAVPDLAMLHRFLRRAWQLARTLPDELLHSFESKTAALPRSTEAERLVVQRVGQDLFRAGLLDYWENRCVVTGLAVPELLRASHIKPWAECASDAERLDVFNGLLLAPHLCPCLRTSLP